MSDNTVDITETSKLDAVKAKAKAVWTLTKTPLVQSVVFTTGAMIGTRVVRTQVDKYINGLLEENSDTDE